jgi:hypothetical protein
MLFELVRLSDQINALNIFRYISFRTGGAIVTALLLVLLLGPALVDALRIRRGRGRVMILSGIAMTALLWVNWSSAAAATGLAALWMLGASRPANGIGKLNRQIIVPAILTAWILSFTVYLTGNANYARYLQIPYIPGVGELAVVCGAVVGAGLACLARERDGCCLSW